MTNGYKVKTDKDGRPIISAAEMMRADCPFTDPELLEILNALKKISITETNPAKSQTQNKAMTKTLLNLGGNYD